MQLIKKIQLSGKLIKKIQKSLLKIIFMKNKRLIALLIGSFIFLNLRSQQFIEQTGIVMTGVDQGSVAWGDYNNDGYLDVLVTGWSGSAAVSKIYKNNGNNTFTEQVAITLPGVFLSSAAWGDYDNDGDLDLLLTGTTNGVTAGAITKIYKNTNGIFTEIPSGLPAVYFGSVSWCDYDKDGKLDILLTGMSGTAERICKIYRNLGGGNFSEVTGTPFVGVMYSSAVWGDYDNDGYPDLFISGQDASINRVAKIYHNNGDGTFTELTNLSLKGVYWSSAAWVDFNSDGLLDLIYSGEDITFNPFTVVYQNNGNNNFTEVTGLSLPGLRKCSIGWGDYNDDGKPDLILSGQSGSGRISQVYQNCSLSTFCSTIESLTGVSDASISLADYDNDGDLDLLITGQDQASNLVTKIYRNNCVTINNTPATPSGLTYSAAGTTATLKWNRVTGDETSSKSISYNLRMGRTTNSSEFVAPHSALTGFRKISAPGNSFIDTAFIFKYLRWDTTYYASVQAIDNSFKGSGFSAAIPIKITPTQPTKLFASYITVTSIQVKWVRGNGDRCIVFVKEGGTGSATPVNNTTYYANSVFKEGSPLGSTGWYCVYKGEADSIQITGLDTQKDYSIHVIEFQGINGSELYATALGENIGVFSTGLFTNQAGISMLGLRRSAVAWGDFNNDGYLDVLIAGQDLTGFANTKIYQNNANNTFTEVPGITIDGVYFGTVDWGDYNNDGYLDILITGYNDALGAIAKVYKNNGNSTFTEQTSIVLTGVYNSSAAWGDYDNDGDLDIMISGLNMDVGPVTKIYRNDGGNVFTEQTGIVLTGLHTGSVALGDYDNDGYLDLLETGFDLNYNRITKLYRNTGNNNFVEQTSISFPGTSSSSCGWGDYDNDGYPDIILTGATGDYPNINPITKIYHNNGDNTFTELTNTGLVNISNGAVAWGDYNNDGFLDILMTGYTGSAYIFKVYQNDGNHSFIDNPFVQLPGAIADGVEWADYDNDGDLDILFSGYTGAVLSRVYKNNTFMRAGDIKPNTKPNTPTGLKSVLTPGNVRLSWNLITNDETLPKNMSYNVRCKLKGSTGWLYSPQALDNGFRNLATLGNAQLNRSFDIKNPGSGTYYWQIQAVDYAFAGGAWSPVDSFLVKNTQAYFKTDTVCRGLPTHFTDQSVVFDGIASWKWDFKDGSISTIQNPVHLYALNGTYNVKLVVTSKAGDKDSLSQNVIVKAIPTTSFTAPNVCIGTPTVLTSNSNLNGLITSGWLWTYGDGLSSTLAQPGTHTFPLKGTYKTQLKAFTTNGCSDSITNNVIIAGYPGTAISIDGKLTICQGDSVDLSAENNPFYTYQWKMDDNNLTNANSSTFSVKSFSGSYSATVTNTLANCVTNTEQKVVTINSIPFKPVIDSGNYQPGKCPGVDPIKLFVDQTVSGYTYQWRRNGIDITDATSPYLSLFSQGAYTIIAKLDICTTPSNVFNISFLDAPPKPVIYAEGPNVWYLVCSDTSAVKYIWYYNGKQIIGADSYLYQANRDYGQYWVAIANDKGCYNASDPVTIPTGITGIENIDPYKGLKIYPNPGHGLLTIEMDNNLFGDMYISVLSQDGKEVMKTKLEKTTEFFSWQLDLTTRPNGLYLITISLKGFIINNKIIIQ
jgi:hypothetical protein